MFLLENYSKWTGFLVLLGWISCLSLVEGQRIAVQKCEEYRKLAFKKQIQHLLTLFPKSIEVNSNNCTNEVQPIARGEAANYGEFPHHALLGFPKENGGIGVDFKCEGTLISDQHVLTAAHCLSREHPTVVRLGEYDTTFLTGEEFEVDIIGIRTHTLFRNSRRYHDIGLVKLANRLKVTNLIRPACLYDTEQRNITRYVQSGFGFTEPLDDTMSTKMMKVQLEEIPSQMCNEKFIYDRRVPKGLTDGQLCIRSIVDGFDTCRGLSGSPLQTVTSKQTCMYHVVGITSYGDTCSLKESIAVHTKISYYLDWIEDNVWGPNAL